MIFRSKSSRLSCILAAVVFFAFFATLHARAEAAQPQVFTAEDLVALKRLSEPRASPDGRQVVFVVRETELDANRARTALWVMDTGTPSTARRLTRSVGSEWSPRWAPDGRSLYFLSSRSGSSQVWRISLADGEALQVTDYPLDVSTFELSAQGDRIAMTLGVFPDCIDLKCSADRLSAPKTDRASGQLYDALFVRHWDKWNDGRLSMLFTAQIGDGGRAVQPVNVSRGLNANLVYEPGAQSDYTFSPDGRRVVFSARVADRAEAWSTNFDLYEAAADGAAAPRNLTAANRAWDAQPVFLANGDLAYLAMARAGFEADRFRILLRDGRTGATRVLTEEWDRSVLRVRATSNGRGLLASADDVGQRSLFAIDITSGRPTRIVGDGQVVDFMPLPGSAALVVWASLASPPDLFLATRRSAPLKRLTQLNANLLSRRRLSEFEQFSFAGWNGEKVYGYLVKPIGWQPGGHYPIALLVHGGPQSSMQNQWNWRWNAQALAGRGYAVIMIDFHGSPGYGQQFTDSISHDWGGKPFVDLQKGLAAAIDRYPWLDGSRACTLGGSFGGYMQNWIAGNWPERFKCIVNHAGTFDTRMMSYTTDELWFSEWEIGGPYYADPQSYERFNPANFIERWRTPMLVIHGALDYRVPYGQGLATFTALQRRGIESRLLYFPDENHWVSKPANVLQWYHTVFDWLDRYLQ